MKLPDKCPACGGNFMFEFAGPQDQYLYASCVLHTNHRITFMLTNDHKGSNELLRMCITINLEKQIKVDFSFFSKTIEVGKGPNPKFVANATHGIPWFDPDLSDYSKLIDKLKTYVIFT